MQRHRRRLPHVYPDGKALFLTWHLQGSLPHARYPPRRKLTSGKAFVWMDRDLDTTRSGPRYLKQAGIARLIVDAIHRGDRLLRHYDLHAYVVMPNHVHMLVTPLLSPSQFMKALKGSTAREANKLLGRTGQPFWQHESYDHWVRNGDELRRITAYIHENPVRAGLVNCAEEFPWSSAGGRRRPGTADTSVGSAS